MAGFIAVSHVRELGPVAEQPDPGHVLPGGGGDVEGDGRWMRGVVVAGVHLPDHVVEPHVRNRSLWKVMEQYLSVGSSKKAL